MGLIESQFIPEKLTDVYMFNFDMLCHMKPMEFTKTP